MTGVYCDLVEGEVRLLRSRTTLSNISWLLCPFQVLVTPHYHGWGLTRDRRSRSRWEYPEDQGKPFLSATSSGYDKTNKLASEQGGGWEEVETGFTPSLITGPPFANHQTPTHSFPSSKGLRAVARWAMRQGLLHQFSLAKEQVDRAEAGQEEQATTGGVRATVEDEDSEEEEGPSGP